MGVLRCFLSYRQLCHALLFDVSYKSELFYDRVYFMSIALFFSRTFSAKHLVIYYLEHLRCVVMHFYHI